MQELARQHQEGDLLFGRNANCISGSGAPAPAPELKYNLHSSHLTLLNSGAPAPAPELGLLILVLVLDPKYKLS